jgi:hypothetical protein
MAVGIKHRKTPEEEELNQKLEGLYKVESELAQCELDLATLQVELRFFEGKYIQIVGIRYAQLDAIKAEIAKLEASLNPLDHKAQEQADRARIQAEESAQTVEGFQESLKLNKFTPSENIKALYREIAKKIHPDFAIDEEEREHRQRLMAEANRAYEDGDETRLKAILDEWENSPDSVKGEGVGAELVRVIRKIAQAKKRLPVIDNEIRQLKQSDLYQLKMKVEESEFQGRDLLGEMASQLDRQISFAQERLRNLKAKLYQSA